MSPWRDRLSWHKDLIRRMALEIDGVRPAFLSKKDVTLIDELRAFRHVFWHIYQSELDVEKLILVDSRAPRAVTAFGSAHDDFLENLNGLISLLQD